MATPPSTTPPSTDQMPLVGLLGRAHDLFVHQFDQRLHESGMTSLSLAHSRNVLRHLCESGLRASELVERTGITKQAISQQITCLEKAGYVAVAADERDQRARRVTLTARGRQAQQLVRQLFTELEADWERQLGVQAMAELRASLTRLLGDTASGGC